MFGRKSNQIKALKQQLEIKDRTLADRHQLLIIRNEDLAALKSENQGLKVKVEELKSNLNLIDQANKELERKLEASTIVSDEALQ